MSEQLFNVVYVVVILDSVSLKSSTFVGLTRKELIFGRNTTENNEEEETEDKTLDR